MSNNNREERNVIPEAAGDQAPPPSTSKQTRRTGKGARQRKTDAFRLKVGTKQLQEKRNEVMKRLGVFDDSCAELEESLKALSITAQPVAVPLPVATRGVGFAAVIEYDRMCSTWNTAAIEEICTIHQFYRVELYLAYYKLYLARFGQGESLSMDIVNPFFMNEEVRQILAAVTQVPVALHNVLSAIGKIQGSSIYHSVPVQDELNSGELLALYLYPTNIRDTVLLLAHADTPAEVRDQFHALNPLPAARWEDTADGWFLRNPDEIWSPGYGPEQLLADVHAYSNVLTRAGSRLPKSFLADFTWSPNAARTGVVSLDPCPISLQARFEVPPAAQARVTRRRDACGRQVELRRAAAQHIYTGDTVVGRATVCLTWSMDHDIQSLELILGAGSLVGEHSGQPTRLQINGKVQAHISPGNIIQRLVDAPRPKMT